MTFGAGLYSNAFARLHPSDASTAIQFHAFSVKQTILIGDPVALPPAIKLHIFGVHNNASPTGTD